MKIHPGFVGIDISKHNLDIFDGGSGASGRIANRAAAIEQVVATWRGCDVFVLFEATGRYDAVLRLALSAAGVRFARGNPARARDFARAAGFLAKTDTIDAQMLAAMAQCLQPGPDAAPDLARERLALLHKRRDQLGACRKQERTRLAEAGELASSLAAHIAWLDDAIVDVNASIDSLLAGQQHLQQAKQLMESVPGIGRVSAVTLLALMPELGARSPKTIAALAGLAPLNADSGKRRGVRQIHGGRRRVREALYMAAVSVTRTRSSFARIYRTMIESGKPAKVALIAVARRMLVTLNAIIRDQKPFEA